MTAEEFLKAGQVEEALAALHDSVRKKPADPRLRRFLFQLLSVLGRWEKALNQLSVLSDLDVDSMLLAQIFRPVIACETLRTEVFAGKRSPLIFGEPEEWVSWLVQAHLHAANGDFAAAQDLQQRALEAAPAATGKINGEPFSWVADADSRLGPVLEAYIDAKYYWIPFHRIQKLEIERPADLRDLIWISAKFSWTNGGETTGLIPVRYPGSEAATDDALRLSRRTDWEEKAPEYYFGLGQRVLATDAGEYSLLEVTTMECDVAGLPAAEASSSEA